jgi:hypothetical protein
MATPSVNWGQYTRRLKLPSQQLQSRTFESLNITALEGIAGNLRGASCRVDTSQYAHGGGEHTVVLELVFDYGVVWIARVTPSETISSFNAGKLVLSEIATMKFLKRETKIPVPTVFGYDASFDNHLVEPAHNEGPFFLAHPDFQVLLAI